MTTKTDLELTKKDKKKIMGKKRNILNQVFFKNYYYYFKFQKSQCILPIFQPLIYFPLRTKTRKVACLGKIKNV